jgi:hypothetical protein
VLTTKKPTRRQGLFINLGSIAFDDIAIDNPLSAAALEKGNHEFLLNGLKDACSFLKKIKLKRCTLSLDPAPETPRVVPAYKTSWRDLMNNAPTFSEQKRQL